MKIIREVSVDEVIAQFKDRTCDLPSCENPATHWQDGDCWCEDHIDKDRSYMAL